MWDTYNGEAGCSIHEKSLCIHACVLSHFSHVQLFATLWTVAHQASLSMRFSRQEYWSGLLCCPPGHLPHPVMESMSLMSPALAGGSFITSATWEAQHFWEFCQFQGCLVLLSRSRKYGGTSLVVQWLGLCAPNAGGPWVWSLVGKLRSCMPQGAAKIYFKRKGWWHEVVVLQHTLARGLSEAQALS